MLAARSPEQPPAKAPGRVSKALMRLLMKRATVIATEPLAENFRLITLEGPALEDVIWTPGQKVRVAMGSAFVARTYTPIEWNASAGRTCILGYAHGDGPGSAWLRDVQPGDEFDLFGPRSSLDLSRIAEPLVLFGDETSIGLAYALSQQDRNRIIACHFEVGNGGGARDVLAQVGVAGATLHARAEHDRHLDEWEAAVPPLATTGASFVLTGRVGAIQRLRRALHRHAIPASRIRTKAYWAPGKRGLD